jgi:hypothetical protein
VQKTTSAACESAIATLASNTDDVPFAILYLLEDRQSDPGQTARLERLCGLLDGLDDLSPLVVDLNGGDQHCLWPLAEVVKTGQGQVISLDDEAGLPRGLAQQTISQAMVLPVISRGDDGAVGVLVAGVNPARKLDAEYRTFL